ncbi:CHAD domain-containing protein [Photobacterium sp. SDRW27]|uniref:CHAD domain-containing protein n=1 Tax=Photobacterium obscurum TaxID=2829490 RepID=UPI00224364F0|nr:CHAD domain-containing protein [Photobacterium obscurum]MCW8327837.1 CHAD domain-containing protein [Photobacterium obscurum]
MSVKDRGEVELKKIQRHKVTMDPGKPIYLSTYAYFEIEFANARRYEAGILQGVDPEFLHQYRVCLRRNRAIISLLKDLYPAENKKRLSDLLKQLMQETNLLRDLDVYLMKSNTFFRQVSQKHHNGLALFFDDIQLRRKTELKRLCGWLNSDLYRRNCQDIEAHIHAIQVNVPPQSASTSCEVYGRQAVWKRYQKVRVRAGDINEQSKDTDIHQLRIDCKKLRYLLEYFEPLFKTNEYQRELNTLKHLQNYLGDFNDSSVQQDFLLRYLARKKENSHSYKAVSQLLRITQREHQKSRVHVLQQLDIFLAVQTESDYEALCQLPASRPLLH